MVLKYYFYLSNECYAVIGHTGRKAGLSKWWIATAIYWWDSGYRARWKDIKCRMATGYPIQNILGNNRWSSGLSDKNNPWVDMVWWNWVRWARQWRWWGGLGMTVISPQIGTTRPLRGGQTCYLTGIDRGKLKKLAGGESMRLCGGWEALIPGWSSVGKMWPDSSEPQCYCN